MMYNSQTTARPYQQKALDRALKKRKFGLFMDPGTGKTKIAIDFCGTLYLEEGITNILIVAPVLAMGVWEDEFEKHLDINIFYSLYHLEGNHKAKIIKEAIQQKPGGLNILIASYDTVVNWEVELSEFCGDILVCDESHYIKNHTTERNKALTRLSKDYPNKLLLTGTPLPKNVLDIFGQFLVMNPTLLGDNWYKFKNTYAVFGGYMKRQLLKWRKLDQLRTVIRENVIRITNDVLGLPPISEIIIPVKLCEKTKALYNEFAKEMIAEYGDNTIVASIPIVKALRLKQITSGFTVNDIHELISISEEKADACEALMDELITAGEKVVVFAHYKYELMSIAKRVQKLGHKPLLIYGGVSRENRDRMRKLFQEDATYPVIICQLAAGGLGIDLFAARYGIFYSLDRQSDHLTQCQGRIYRRGQTKPVFFYYLIVRGTIDRIVYDSNKAKIDLSERLTTQEIKLL